MPPQGAGADTESLRPCNTGLDEKDKKFRDLTSMDFDGVSNSTISTSKQVRFSMWEATSTKCSGTRADQPHPVDSGEDSVQESPPQPQTVCQLSLQAFILGRDIEMLLVKGEISLIEHLQFKFTICPNQTQLHLRNYFKMKKIESPLMGKFKSTLPGWVGLRKTGMGRTEENRYGKEMYSFIF